MCALAYGTVQIDGKAYALVDKTKVNESANDRFPVKVTTGDYTLDSNDLLSADVMGNYSGGSGVSDRREGVQDDRYLISTIYTRHPNKLSKPFRITRNLLNAGVGNVTPLGDMYDTGAWHNYYDLGGTLYKDAVSVGSISFQPVNRSEVFQGLAGLPYLFIPQGENGYSTYEPVGDTRQTTSGSELVVAFLRWNTQLIAVDTDGQLYHTETAAAAPTFTDYGDTGKLDESCRPKNLLSYWNRANEKSIYLVSDNGLFVFDPATPQLYEIPDITSVHPRFGEGSCTGNGMLYVSAGMDVIEFNGSVGRNIGLSRDDGLPSADVGTNPYIVDLISAQNSMYAMVLGSSGTITSIHEYSYANQSWHMIETRTLANAGIGLGVSRASSLYRVMWGGGDGVLSAQSLPMDFTNPDVVGASSFGYAAGTGVGDFFTEYVLTTAYFDGGLPGYVKVANSFQIDWNVATGHSFQVAYRVDEETHFTQLCMLDDTDTGVRTVSFGQVSASGVYPGVSFRKIQFQFTIFEPSNSALSPIIESLIFSFMKMMNPSWSWSVQLDLTKTHDDRSPEQMFDDLVDLKDSASFYSFQFQEDEIFSARIAALSDVVGSAEDTRRQVQLSIVEIRPQFGAQVLTEIVE